MGNILFTMFWLFFVCSYKEKTEARRVSKVSHVFTTPLGVIYSLRCYVKKKNVMVNQGIFYFVEGGRRLRHAEKKVSAIPNYVYDVNL